jgi:hypothetical protein
VQANANNIVLPATAAVIPSCAKPNATAGTWTAGCATAVASPYLEISNYPDCASTRLDALCFPFLTQHLMCFLQT